MRVSLNWLKDYVDIGTNVDALAHELTMLGLEIELIERPGAEIRNVVVGKILSIKPHPNADKLVVCRTDIGEEEPLQIVCGAKNMKAGDLVPTAVVGATLPGGFTIDRRKMRGLESFGMMCSKRELGLGEDHHGLYILNPDLPIGEDVKPLLGLDDAVLEVSITPNRGDWACMIGIAREIAAHHGATLRIPQPILAEEAKVASDYASVTIEAPDLCPHYIARILRGVKIGPSPEWMQQRLIAAGQRPISNIVDITNYVMLETGQPLHAFDYDKLGGNRIVVRTAQPGEVLVTIDEQERSLADRMLVIADAERAVALAGIMGGNNSEVGEGTANILLESAYFDPINIRRTARALGMQTEASARFQRGADPEMSLYAVNRAAGLMADLAGASVAGGVIDVYPKPVARPTVTLRYTRTNRMLGTEIPADIQAQHLSNLGFTKVEASDSSSTWQVPSWRPDVSHEADLIEEVARLDGYEKIPTTLPKVHPTDVVLAPQERVLSGLKHLLVAQGLTEMVHWSFSSHEELQKAGLGETHGRMVALQNPLSENHATMRTSLLPALLRTAAMNMNHGSQDIAAFEVACVYQDEAGAVLPRQTHTLSVILSGNATTQHWSAPQRLVDFYDLKGVLEAVAEHFGISLDVRPTTGSALLKAGLAADIATEKGDFLGMIGELGPQVQKAFGIEQPVYLLEMNLDALLAAPQPRPQFQVLPKFPASLRDLAVVVDAQVSAATLRNTALRVGGGLLKRVDIFDVYTGKPIPDGRKSIALSLAFQSEDRTLTDGDTNAAMDIIVKELAAQHGAAMR